MAQITIREGLSYDDALLVPQYSEILPSDVNTITKLGHLTLVFITLILMNHIINWYM